MRKKVSAQLPLAEAGGDVLDGGGSRFRLLDEMQNPEIAWHGQVLAAVVQRTFLANLPVRIIKARHRLRGR